MAPKAQIKFENSIINYLRKNKSPASATDISRALNVRKKSYNSFRSALQHLVSEKRILKQKESNKYTILSRARIITGELRITRGGFGFVEDEQFSVDVYIGRDHLNTAFDRDIVEVKLYARSRGKNEDGYVSKIVRRSRNKFVGTFHLSKYYGYVVPDDRRVYRDFFIPKEKQGKAKNGQKVVVLLDSWATDHLNPEGSILEIIGFAGEPGVDVASVAHSFQIDIKFPGDVEEEANNISGVIKEAEISNRLDLRNIVSFTIDPEEAKDFDDAVSLEVLPSGNYKLGVHIADVSHYVKEKTSLDREAYNRATSVYLVDRVIPMLPEKLSNEVCSLQPHVDKLTYSCIMEVTPGGQVIKYNITPSVIQSKRRFTYEEVEYLIKSDGNEPLTQNLKEMMKLSKTLTKKRLDEGGIDFDTPEVKFELDQNGFPQKISRTERLDSNRLIEEFMLLANKTVAEHILTKGSENKRPPFVYRIHEKPDPEKIQKFFNFLTALKIPFKPSKKITSQYFQGLLNGIKGTKEELLIEEVALRSMMKAIYSPKNLGHFGLGFKDYTHFTSPIRRYPDLIVHRLLRGYNQDDPNFNISKTTQLNKICEQATRMERQALEAERESIRLKQNEYISKHIGEQFEGIISGVMSFGIFVELVDTLVEGLVHIRDLDGYYIYDEKTYRLISRDTNRDLRLGDSVRIEVAKVNLEEGKVDFKLVNNTE
jgi:ribonuclease R